MRKQPAAPGTEHAGARLILTLALLTMCLLAATAPDAHAGPTSIEPQGVLPGVPLPTAGPNTPYALYGYLGPGDDGDLYSFAVSEPLTATLRLAIPAFPEHEDFRPDLYLQPQGSRPIHVPDPSGPRESEFDALSLTSLWSGAELEYGFRPGTRYVLLVDPGEGVQPSGRYVLFLGSPGDTPTPIDTILDLPTLWFGGYGGAPSRFNPLAMAPLGALLLFVGGIAASVRFIRRRRRPRRRRRRPGPRN